MYVPQHPRPHVFLLHGAFGTRWQMRRLARGLEAHGHPTTCLALPFRFGHGSIPAMAERLREEVARRQHPERKALLVGFSMGAIVCRYYLQRLDGTQSVDRFLSLAGPHQGTKTAFLLPLPVIRDLRPNSALIRDLEREADPWRGVRVAAFLSPWDPIILPPRSARLPHCSIQRQFRVWPHRAVLSNPNAVRAAIQFLSEAPVNIAEAA